jgi:hypothetical protein
MSHGQLVQPEHGEYDAGVATAFALSLLTLTGADGTGVSSTIQRPAPAICSHVVRVVPRPLGLPRVPMCLPAAERRW